jgi:cytochrome c biogenesis protein CcmG/thiol:disulfide interchange protein DsbE
LLVKDVAAEFGGRVRVVVEEYDNSKMAERFGVRRYPAVFVDDILLARPKDFGFGGPEDVSGGLYVPWREPANQRRFKDDLRRAVARRLAGEQVAGLDVAELAKPAASLDGPPRLPGLTLESLGGRRVALEPGRVIVVELWATWCPPCRSTLQWLNTFQDTNREDVTVVAIAVDSAREDVERMAAQVKANYHVVMGTEPIVNAFGAVAAVPKVLVFDRTGSLSAVIHGAPPDLHQQLEAAVAAAR